jgi:phage shock protein PspC (stress-responsive transcriptional regulator)
MLRAACRKDHRRMSDSSNLLTGPSDETAQSEPARDAASNDQQPPQPPQPPTQRGPQRRERLTRRSDHKMVAGVCAGLGDHFEVDPVLFRVAFVVLALIGGAGLLLYALLWILLPTDTGPGTMQRPGAAQRAVSRSRRTGVWLGIAILVVGSIILINDVGHHGPFGWAFRPGIVWGVALVLLGILLYQRGERRGDDGGSEPYAPSASAPAPPSIEGVTPVPQAATATATGNAPSPEIAPPVEPLMGGADPDPAGLGGGGRFIAPLGAAAATGSAPPVEPFDLPATAPVQPLPWMPAAPAPVVEKPRRRRQRSALGWVTLGAALLGVGLAALLDQWGAIDMTLGRYFALALLVMGAGLLVGTWWGRARWLIVLGILTIPFVLAASLITVPVTGGVGTRSIHPVAVEQIQPAYRLAAGQLAIDLTSLDLAGTSTTITASVAFGNLSVRVPDDVPLTIHATAGAGVIDVSSENPSPFDRSVDGGSISLDQTNGTGTAAITLNVAVGYGRVAVFRAATPSLG